MTEVNITRTWSETEARKHRGDGTNGTVAASVSTRGIAVFGNVTFDGRLHDCVDVFFGSDTKANQKQASLFLSVEEARGLRDKLSVALLQITLAHIEHENQKD